MLSPNGICSLLLGAGLLSGTLLLVEAPKAADATGNSTRVAMSEELAQVLGREDPPADTPWEEKCCETGARCTPQYQAFLPAVTQCWMQQAYTTADRLFRAGCVGQWSCIVDQGPRTINQKCSAPPAGAIVVPRCALDPIDCVTYKVGSCVANWALYCVCDVNANAQNRTAPGAYKCRQGSNTCAGIVPPAPVGG